MQLHYLISRPIFNKNSYTDKNIRIPQKIIRWPNSGQFLSFPISYTVNDVTKSCFWDSTPCTIINSTTTLYISPEPYPLYCRHAYTSEYFNTDIVLNFKYTYISAITVASSMVTECVMHNYTTFLQTPYDLKVSLFQDHHSALFQLHKTDNLLKLDEKTQTPNFLNLENTHRCIWNHLLVMLMSSGNQVTCTENTHRTLKCWTAMWCLARQLTSLSELQHKTRVHISTIHLFQLC